MSAERIVLAFDTATESVAIGVGARAGDRVRVIAARDFEAPRAAMSGLLPAVCELLGEVGLDPRDVGEVVVGRGPGSFTGVRIGVATAKGLAHGLEVELMGVGTLDAIAWGVPDGWTGSLGVVGDAMRGEIYPAIFEIFDTARGREVRRREPDHVRGPAEVAADWARLHEPLTLCGNGLGKYERVFTDALGPLATLAPPGWWAPTGAGLLRAYEASLADGTVVGGDPGIVLPVYTRLSDAEETERARAGMPQTAPPTTGVAEPPSSTSKLGSSQ